MPRIAPSKNPQKESSQFAIAAVVCSVASLFLWFLGIMGIAFGIRAAILSRRIKNTQRLILSLAAVCVSAIGIGYYLLFSAS